MIVLTGVGDDVTRDGGGFVCGSDVTSLGAFIVAAAGAVVLTELFVSDRWVAVCSAGEVSGVEPASLVTLVFTLPSVRVAVVDNILVPSF